MNRCAWCLMLVLAAGCRGAVNYGVSGPRYSGTRVSAAAAPDRIRVVSFNVKYAARTDLAVALLRGQDSLRGADIVLLQEMDAPGAQAIADSLDMSYVYYPATVSPNTGRDFGNAVLSRYPILDDHKVVLPHHARIGGTERAAVGATIMIGTRRVRVYSVHLATLIGNGPNGRRDQLRAVLADADSLSTVIIGGDFNSETVPEVAEQHGYRWPTQRLRHTNSFWTFDHFLLKGVMLADSTSVGVVPEVHGASDHKPVWAVVALPTTAANPPAGPGSASPGYAGAAAAIR